MYLAAVKGQLEVQAMIRVCILKAVYGLPAIIAVAMKLALYYIYSQIRSLYVDFKSMAVID